MPCKWDARLLIDVDAHNPPTIEDIYRYEDIDGKSRNWIGDTLLIMLSGKFIRSISAKDMLMGRRVFIEQPYPPYDEGDLWTDPNNELRRCKVARETGEFNESDWELATKPTVGKGELINGVKIDADSGLVVTRSDEKVRSILNATTGIAIQKNDGTTEFPNWIDRMNIDIDGNINLFGPSIGIE